VNTLVLVRAWPLVLVASFASFCRARAEVGRGCAAFGARSLHRNGLVHTESFDDFPGESRVTTEVTAWSGETTLTITVLSPSKEVRDAILRGGTDCMAECYDKLAGILAVSTEDAVAQRAVQAEPSQSISAGHPVAR
jgi:hypothetical protein